MKFGDLFPCTELNFDKIVKGIKYTQKYRHNKHVSKSRSTEYFKVSRRSSRRRFTTSPHKMLKFGPAKFYISVIITPSTGFRMTNQELTIIVDNKEAFSGSMIDNDDFFNISVLGTSMFTPEEFIKLRKYMLTVKQAKYFVYFTPFINYSLILL